MLTPSCSAFRFDDNSCQLYDATYLYKDKTDNGMDVYMHDTLWNQRGNTRILSLVNVFFAVNLNRNLSSCDTFISNIF